MIDLKSKGWIMFHKCHCGGSLKQYWRHLSFPGWQLIVRPTKLKVQILKNNHQKAAIWAYQLETKLTEYAINS